MSSRKRQRLSPWVIPALLLAGTAFYLLAVKHGAPDRPADSAAPPAPRAAAGDEGRDGSENAARTEKREPAATPVEAEDTGEATAYIVRIVDAATREPLRAEKIGVRVRGEETSIRKNITTDGEGRFPLQGLHAGEYSLTIRHIDYLPASRSIEVEEGASEAPWNLEVPLEPGEWLTGEVVDREGRAVASAVLKLSLLRGARLAGKTAQTGEDGSFVVRGLSGGAWRIAAASDGFRRKTLDVAIPADGPIRIVLTEDPGVEIRVVNLEGGPVPGARAAFLLRTGGAPARRRSGLTGGGGAVRLFGLSDDPQEKLTLEVRHPEYLPHRETLAAAELSGGTHTVVLSHGVDVSGRVLDADRAPVAGAEVVLSNREGTLRRVLKTVSSGEYIFHKVAPGTYEVTASTPTRGAGRIEDITVDAVDDAGGLEVVLQTGEGKVAGRVLTSTGAPVPLCEVKVAVPSAGLELRTVTREDGTFRFNGLAAPTGAECSISAWGRRLSSVRDMGAAVGDEEIVLRVERTGSIRCLLSGEGPPRSFTVVLTPEEGSAPTAARRRFQLTSQDRWFRLDGVAPGTYAVSVTAGGEVLGEARHVEVLAGKETGPIKMGPHDSP